MGAPLKDNRIKADKLRKTCIRIYQDVVDEKLDYGLEFKKQLLLKLAPTVLPRINEHTGEDGQPIIIKFDDILKIPR